MSVRTETGRASGRTWRVDAARDARARAFLAGSPSTGRSAARGWDADDDAAVDADLARLRAQVERQRGGRS